MMHGLRGLAHERNRAALALRVGRERTGIVQVTPLWEPGVRLHYVPATKEEWIGAAASSIAAINPLTRVQRMRVYSGVFGLASSTIYGMQYIAATDRVWLVSNATSGRVFVMNPYTMQIDQAPIVVGSSPLNCMFCPTDGYVYVSNYGSASISIIDPRTLVVLSTVTVGSNPQVMWTNPVDGKVWVICRGANRLDVIDPATHTATTSVITTGFADASAAAWWAQQNRLAVSNNGNGNVLLINPATVAITNTLTASGAASHTDGCCVVPSTNELWAGDYVNGTVYVFDASFAKTTFTGAITSSLAYQPLTGEVWGKDAGTTAINVYSPKLKAHIASLNVA